MESTGTGHTDRQTDTAAHLIMLPSLQGWGHKSLTLVPWKRVKPLSWDVTVICLLADSYVEPCQEAGSAVELLAKYSALWAQYDFQLVAIEILGPLNESANFSTSTAKKLVTTQATIGRLAFYFNGFVLVQLFNAVLLNDSFMCDRIPSFLLSLTFNANIISVMLTTTFQHLRRKQPLFFSAAAKADKPNFSADFW